MQINLADLNSPQVWLAFICATIMIDTLGILNFRLFPKFFGSYVNIWYDQFGIIAFMLDIIIIFIAFWVTQWLYTKLFGNAEFQLWKFVLLFLLVQVIHDITFYNLIVKGSNGSNAILELFKKYGNKHGYFAVLGDSVLITLSTLLAYGLLSMNTPFGTYIIYLLLSIYAVGYLLYQRWE
jgi:hypothetical protein